VADADWMVITVVMVIRGPLRGIMSRPSGGQPPADISAARGLANGYSQGVFGVFNDY
jgi:hypothetical protein